MLWAIWCKDGTDIAELRAEHGPAHSKHLSAAPFRVVMAGPLTSDDGRERNGSLLIFEAESRAEVEAYMRADPFLRFGIWAELKIAGFLLSRETLSQSQAA